MRDDHEGDEQVVDRPEDRQPCAGAEHPAVEQARDQLPGGGGQRELRHVVLQLHGRLRPQALRHGHAEAHRQDGPGTRSRDDEGGAEHRFGERERPALAAELQVDDRHLGERDRRDEEQHGLPRRRPPAGDPGEDRGGHQAEQGQPRDGRRRGPAGAHAFSAGFGADQLFAVRTTDQLLASDRPRPGADQLFAVRTTDQLLASDRPRPGADQLFAVRTTDQLLASDRPRPGADQLFATGTAAAAAAGAAAGAGAAARAGAAGTATAAAGTAATAATAATARGRAQRRTGRARVRDGQGARGPPQGCTCTVGRRAPPC